MTILKVLHYPDKRLKSIGKPVLNFDKKLSKLADDMLETMYSEKGIGLAAVQVNVLQRVVVMDLSEEKNKPIIRELCNEISNPLYPIQFRNYMQVVFKKNNTLIIAISKKLEYLL